MKKFEYHSTHITLEQIKEAGYKHSVDWYNYMGKSGWELIIREYHPFPDTYFYLFKREVIDPFPLVTKMEQKLEREEELTLTRAYEIVAAHQQNAQSVIANSSNQQNKNNV